MSDHRCTIGTLDYGNADDGYILCDTCGRMYRLTGSGWSATPRPAMSAETRMRKFTRRRGG